MSVHARWVFAALLFTTTTSFAGSLNPGLYVGVMGGGGTMGALDFPGVGPKNNGINFVTKPATSTFVWNSGAGRRIFGLLGDVGVQLGYRYCNFRLEGEFLFGGSSTKVTELDSATQFSGPFPRNPAERVLISGEALSTGSYDSQGIILLPGRYIANVNYYQIGNNNRNFLYREKQLFFSGFVNLLYDFYSENSDVSFVPYIGIGIGAMHLSNTLSVFFQDFTLSPYEYSATFKTANFSSAMGQGIIGATYLLDDFSNIGLDFRYMVTRPLTQFADNRLSIYTLNLVFNYTFDQD